MTAGLIPADAVMFQAAHMSRAHTFSEWIDPSVIDENDPDRRDPELDLYHPDNKPPYSAAWLAKFRAAQLARAHRRTAWVRDTLEHLKRSGSRELERGFVTHRTMADPRFLDGSIEPNDRPIGTCFMGVPEVANNGRWALRDSRRCGRGFRSGRSMTATRTVYEAHREFTCPFLPLNTRLMMRCRNPIPDRSTARWRVRTKRCALFVALRIISSDSPI